MTSLVKASQANILTTHTLQPLSSYGATFQVLQSCDIWNEPK